MSYGRELNPAEVAQIQQCLAASMSDDIARRLGAICMEAASSKHLAGDLIDRGMILQRLLEENGFRLSPSNASPP